MPRILGRPIAVRIVDDAMDDFLRQNHGATEVLTVELALLAGIPVEGPSGMSQRRQEYRRYQRAGRTKYNFSCTGKGPRVPWKIMSKPGSDPRRIQQNRVSQTQQVTDESIAEWATTIACEIYPSLKNTDMDQEIKQVLPLIQGQFNLVIQHLTRVFASAAQAQATAATP